jgi:thiosulfate/3-mercaptopyruvate sulfurtransferase
MPPSDPLISAPELAARIADPNLRIADVRWFLGDAARGWADYSEGHLPGAIFVDLDRDLAAASGPGRHPLPHPTGFADRMGQLGFGDGHFIVAYDQVSGMVASRLWWMLDRLGHREVAVLDGGLAAWMAAGGELTRQVPTPIRASLTLATSWTDTLDRDGLIARAGQIDLVDLRAAERYRGEIEPVDAQPGHIPGARNRPAAELLDEAGVLLPPDGIRERLLAGAPASGAPMVMSCGSGVTACYGALAARVARLDDPMIYPGSYSDWSAAGLPVATGAEVGVLPAEPGAGGPLRADHHDSA